MTVHESRGRVVSDAGEEAGARETMKTGLDFILPLKIRSD